MATAEYTRNRGGADTALVTPASLLAAAEHCLADARAFAQLGRNSAMFRMMAENALGSARMFTTLARQQG